MKITHILTFITIIFLVTTCEHKELCFAHAHTTEMQVIFNWKYAPEAHRKYAPLPFPRNRERAADL